MTCRNSVPCLTLATASAGRLIIPLHSLWSGALSLEKILRHSCLAMHKIPLVREPDKMGAGRFRGDDDCFRAETDDSGKSKPDGNCKTRPSVWESC